jgi:hypothetical protein
MNLPGRLRLTTLGDLLGRLHRAGAHGVLELMEAGGVNAGRLHRVFLSGGLVDRIETELEPKKLGEFLYEEGELGTGALHALRMRVRESSGQRAGEILLRELLATEGAIGRALRRQLKARLEAIFRLGDAVLRFSVRRPPRTAGVPVEPLTPVDFLYGRPRAQRATPPPEAPVTGLERSVALGILGLGPTAGIDEARQAFRRLARAHHPDRFPRATAEEVATHLKRFSELSAAYHALDRRPV